MFQVNMLQTKLISRFVRQSDRLLSLLLYIISLIIHFVLVAYPPSNFFYNAVDELEITFSCLDRFLGLPSTMTAEPVSVLHMIAVPLFLADFALTRLVVSSPLHVLDRFALYLADGYADPHHHVILLRVVIALITSAAPVLLFAICRKLGADRGFSLLCAIVFSSLPVFFAHSLMVAGDSVGLIAVLGSILVLLQDEKRARARLVAGFLFGMAVGFKITMASSICILLAIIIADIAYRDRRIRRLVTNLSQLMAGVIAGVLLWCPYLWIDPMRSAKSILRNVNKAGTHVEFIQFIDKLKECVGLGFLALMAVTFVASLWLWRHNRAKWLVLALVCCTLVESMPLLMHAGTAYPRHFIPLALPSLLGFVLIAENAGRLSKGALSALFLLTLATLLLWQRAERVPNELVLAARSIPALPPISKIYVPEEIVSTYALRLPSSTYRRISARAKRELYDGKGIAEALRGVGMSDTAIDVLVTAFNEREQVNVARTAAAAESDLPSLGPSREVYLYRTVTASRDKEIAAQRASWAELDSETAVSLLRGNEAAAILVKSDGLKPGRVIWQDSQWVWCVNDSWPQPQ